MSPMGLQFHVESFEVGESLIQAGLLRLENAALVLVWMGEEPKLGSLCVSLPGGRSTMVLGDRFEVLARVVCERVSHVLGCLALVSIHLPKGVEERGVVGLVDKLLGGLSEES